MSDSSPRTRFLPITLVLWCVVASALEAQVQARALYAAVKVRTLAGTCSGFRLSLPPKLYLVTARHCVPSATGPTWFEVWRDEKWVRKEGSFVFPSNPEVDIAAVELLDEQFGDRALGWDGSVSIGGPVYFLGYPSNLATRGKIPAPSGFGEIPFVKSGILSAIDARQADRVVHYVDGHNNPGFSGGPLVHKAQETGAFSVFAVISGFRSEATPVLKSKDLRRPDAKAYDELYVRGNSGIVIGYSVRHIVDAIQLARGAK